MHTLADPTSASAAALEDEEAFVFPLSFAQQRLWFLDRMEPGNPFYNVPAVLLLEGALDLDAFVRTLGEIVRRHETLRTVFEEEEGEPVQVVLPWRPVPLPVHDLSALDEEARRAEVERRAAVEARRPFDLEAGPLFRAELLRLDVEEHVLLLSMHHIVSDGWSVGVLLREMAALYGAFVRGEASPLPELPIQYADFAVWERERLSGERLEAQLAYWRDQLRDPPVLELPTDRPRPPVPSFRGASAGFTVSAATAGALRDLARAEDATLFMPLLAAFQVLLGRYAGQEDVIAGTPVANRNRSEIEGLIGFFINALALRADLSGDPPFRVLLRQVRERTFGAYAHQDVPFDRIVEDLSPERDLSRAPVFQAMFSLQNAPAAEVEEDTPLRVGVYGGKREVAKWDLTLTLQESGDEIHGSLGYATDLFDAATAERITAHYAALLDGVAAGPDRRLSELPIMDAAERRLVLHDWNATARPYDARPVHLRIAEQAARTPDAAAVVSPSGELTYAALESRAASLAGRLRAAGVRPDDRVGLFLERSAGTVVAVLGILKAGAAYVALDPSYPDDRLLFMLQDAGASAVVTEPGLAGRIAGYGGAVLGVEGTPLPPAPSPARGEGENGNGTVSSTLPQNWGRVASLSEPGGGAAEERESPLSHSRTFALSHSLAYVIYTSGSTGTPKGVLVTHRGLSNYLAWFDEAVLGPEGFALPLVSRLSFDAHVRQLFPPLLRGEPVWILPEETVADPRALLEALGTRGRVSFGGVPSLWSAMLELIRAGEAPRPEGLRAVLLGGEALPAELAERTFALFPGVALWNHYGPTEATVNTTVARVRPGEPVRIGGPVANVRVYLLDARGGPVPVGVPGELYVGGAGVSRGYLGRPELTAERFVPDPFSGEPGARMYRSGDRVRRREDGELEYVGRTDFQVKVRGFRIELGEIESALERHPRVREAAVALREDAPGAGRLVGYVVAEGGDAPAADELRAHLAERLPEYMVPVAFVALEALPLSPNGKLDRRALPAPEAEAAGEAAGPRTPTEEILAGVWAELLRLDRVGVHDNFFAVGGHSLLATRVVSRVRSAFGVELPLRAVFEAPTLAGLAERVDAALREGVGVRVPPLRPVPRDGSPLPLSFAQQRLWFIQQMEPESPAYNLPYALRLRGPLDLCALERSLDAIRARHESLRTVFALSPEGPVQVVAPPARTPLPEVDLRALPDAARAAEVARRVREEAVRPFDLARGPVMRATLLRLGDDDRGLLLTLHHIASDGWSSGILTAELSAFYAGFAAGAEVRLPELPVQYPDFAAWQRGWLEGETLERQLAYWRERLAGAPPLLELPTDRPRPPVQSPRGAHRAFELSPAASIALRELARREGATLFMVLLAGWQALLARYSGQDDVSVGTPVAGRTRLELERLIGFFVNTLVVRADLSGRPSLRSLVHQVRETTLGAYAHQDVPFEKLVEELRPERSLQHTPFFQALLVLQNNEGGTLRLEGVSASALEKEGETTHFDLALALVEDGDRILGAASYRTELFDAETVDRMLRHYAALLDGAAADPDRPLAAVPLLSAAERDEVLVLPNRTAAAYPPLCLHQWVDARLRDAPDEVALVAGGQRVTCAELDAGAERVARRLRRLGVGPEVRVGVFLDRTPAMVGALLGVLRAGGAYVPLDPAYPRERTALTLEDSGARVVLTQASLAGALPTAGGVEVVRLDADLGADDDAEEAPAAAAVDPDNAALLIYTSGSTGRPKGVVIRHRNVVALLAWAETVFPPEDRAGVLFSTSISFDLSVFELFLPLATGGTVVLARNVLQLADAARSAEVTLVNTVPSAFAELLRAGALPPTVRTVSMAGEPLPAALAEAAYALGHVERVVNLYGPSEDTTYSTWAVVERGSAAPPPIGVPLSNTRAYVLDRDLQPVPPGVAGELYLSGDGLARGYLDRPGLTAERWLPDPFGGAGERMYRTGDLARRRRGGALEFLGRNDQQVKVRGFRIEPGEVEAALAAHPGVREAVVAARDDHGERRLVGYVVPAADALDVAELRAWLRDRLPEHMVPTAWAVLPALPLTASGKTDRAALPAPDGGAPQEGFVAPRGPVEEALARIWEEVLHRAPVGAHDDFFALGGHSLLVMQVVARVRAVLGVELPVAALFERPTLAALAALVEAGGAQPRRTGPIRRADRSNRTIRDPGTA